MVFLLLTLSGADTSASGGGIALYGTVRDAEDNSPVRGATVEVNGTSSTTDSEGRYLLKDLKAGKFQASVRADGYITHREEFEIPYPGNYRKDFYLTRNRVRVLISILDDYSLQPVRARIRVDNRRWIENDESGVATVNLKEGVHELDIFPLSDMYRRKSLKIHVSGETHVEKITLIPAKINLGDLKFETGKHDIEDYMEEKLEMACGILKRYPQARVVVEGHTDTRGSARYNLNLSRKRAEAVREWLVNHGCVSPERIKAVGYGESRPIVYPERKPEDYAKNRRVVLKLEMP